MGPNVDREAHRTAELLSTHAGGLRALAFELVGDAHAAEDVLQDTYLRAVGRAPASASPSGVRAWLREVVRGLASNHKRGAAHRAERETAYARSTNDRAHSEAEVDARERGESLRRVVAAVLALDDPYKTTVLLRYFEGLAPTEIAARTNTPLATVASRLQRAHQKLRGELERDGRDLVGALAPLLGLAWTTGHSGVVAGAASIGKGVFWMGLKTSVAAAAVLLAALCWWWWAQGPEAPLARDAGGLASAKAAELAITPLDAAAEPAERTAREAALASTSPTASAIGAAGVALGAGPHEFELELSVVDQLGLPQPGVTIDAAPDGQPLADFGVTAWNGKLRKRWRGFEPALDLFVRAKSSTAGETDLRHVRLAAGVSERACLALPLTSEHGGRVALDGVLHLRVSNTLMLSRAVDLNEFVASGTSSSSEGFTLDEHGNGVFLDPFLYAADPVMPVLGELPLLGNLFRSQAVRIDSNLVFTLRGEALGLVGVNPSASAEPATFALAGRLRLANGAPAAGVPVLLHCEQGDARSRTVADENGAFAFDGLSAGPAIVCAGGPGSGIVVRELALAPSLPDLDLRLDDRGTLFVRLVDEHGTPLSSWRVEAWADAAERDYVRGAQCGDDGRATLFDVGAAPLYLSARPVYDDGTLVPAKRIAERVWAQKDELVLVVAGGKELARVAFELASASGLASEEGLARLVRDDGVACVPVRSHTEGEDANARRVWSLGGIVPGIYRLVAGAPGETWMDLGRFEFASGAALVLGEHRFAPRARVAIEFEHADERERADGRLFVVRNGAVSCSKAFSVPLPGEFGIPRGASSIVWTRRAAKTASPTDAETGAERALVIDSATQVDRFAVDASRAREEQSEEHGAAETRALDGRPGATTKLVLPSVATKPR
ncbi:MAG: sigma-70 family RNA polymerase sigma factor [Planctomycetes bacterium]|nr:sigma-70 family RNA polymerase sigma factor [Planctomycetota bacterium]